MVNTPRIDNVFNHFQLVHRILSMKHLFVLINTLQINAFEALELLLGSTPKVNSGKCRFIGIRSLLLKNAIILVVTGILESWLGGRSKWLGILAKSLFFDHVKNPAGLKMTTTSTPSLPNGSKAGTIRQLCRRTSCGPQVDQTWSMDRFFPKAWPERKSKEDFFVEWFFSPKTIVYIPEN